MMAMHRVSDHDRPGPSRSGAEAVGASAVRAGLGWIGALVLGLSWPASASAQTPVLTRSYNNARTGANTTETVLTPNLVAAHGMVKRFSLQLTGDDPRIEAQPLYVPGLVMSDGRVHNVLYVFSMGNKVYAFDADTGAAIWPQPVSLGPPFHAPPGDPVDSKGINKTFGELSTPVIDLDSRTIYITNWVVDQNNNRIIHLNALNLIDGRPRQLQPLTMAASVTNAAGVKVSLSQVQKQRSAMLLVPLGGHPAPPAHKLLYVGFTGAEDPPRTGNASQVNHGWLLAFDVDAWEQVGAWISTPSSFGGGIWAASQGPAADEQGYVYLMTGNGGYLLKPDGSVGSDFNGTTDFAECFVKLAFDGGALRLVDWFSPFRDSRRKFQPGAPGFPGYGYTDQDLGSAGPVLVPGTNLILGAGKDGVLYVLDRNNLGKAIGDFSKLKAPPIFFTFDPDRSIPAYKNADPAGDLDFQPMLGVKTHHLHGSPAYWKSAVHGPMLFVWGENGNLRAYALDVASGKAKLLAHGAEFASEDLASPSNRSLGGMPGGMLAVSANGEDQGIVWATAPLDGDANQTPVPGIIRAYDATRFAPHNNPDGTPRLQKIWQASGFTYSKFCPPVVADGRLFVPTYDGRVDVYVLRDPSVPHRVPN
jgi:outer membrane protein assembly factor BamB